MILSRRALALVVLAATTIAACSGDDDGGATSGGEPSSSTSSPTSTDDTTDDTTESTDDTTESTEDTTDDTDTTDDGEGDTGELSAREVLAAVSPSVVFIETDWATGTGIVVDGGYVLTNAHVVTPFDRVDVSPPASRAITDVPVVAIDLAADLALLGPIDADLPPAATGSIDGLGGGDAVYLIGYPGENDDEPTATIAEGIVSRLRTADDGLSFVQTDAAIAGGQSGGALADANGRVVAISGMSVDEAFALGLSMDSALERVPGLRAGGDPWVAYPSEGATSGTVIVDGKVIGGHLDVIAVDGGAARSITLGISPDVAGDVALVITLDDGTSYISANALPLVAEQLGVEIDALESQIPDDLILTADLSGSYAFDLPGGMTAAVSLFRISEDQPIQVAVTSNEPMALWADADDGLPIAIGESVDGLLEPLEYQDVYLLDLVEGDEVELIASSTLGDPNIIVVAPGEVPGPTTFSVDDDDLGFLGLDARGTFTASATGIHRIIVGDSFGQSAYTLSVERA